MSFSIPHFRDIIKKEGLYYVKKMLEFGIFSVNIKVDQMSFNHMIDDTGNCIDIKRNGNSELRLIDIIANDNYAKAAQTLNFTQKISGLYQNNAFYFEYFPENPLPTYLSYDFIPRNRIVFSYIHNLDTNLRYPRARIAPMFEIEEAPTILDFEYLNDKTIRFLTNWAENPDGDFVDFVRTVFVIPEELEKFLPENKIEGLVFFNVLAKDKNYSVFKMIDSKYEIWKKDQDNSIEQHLKDVCSRTISTYLFTCLTESVDEVLANFSKVNSRTTDYFQFIGILTNKVLESFSGNMDSFKSSVDDNRFANLDIKTLNAFGVNCDFTSLWYGQDFYRMLMFWLSQDRKQVSFRSGIGKEQIKILNGCVDKIRSRGLIE